MYKSRKIKLVIKCKKVFHRNIRFLLLKNCDFAMFSTVSTEFSTVLFVFSWGFWSIFVERKAFLFFHFTIILLKAYFGSLRVDFL